MREEQNAATPAGRFAPSPSADLHIGNLRTAVLAWLFARSTDRRFLMRVEDLDDRTHDDIAERQLADLAALGITWDGPATRQTGHPQRARIGLRMLLHPKGYRVSTAGAARP